MANANCSVSASSTRVCFLFIFMSLLFMRLQARNVLNHHDHHMKMISRSSSDINSQRLLRELIGFDLSRLVGQIPGRRSLTDRLAPGGPDPQHHF
ncbi:CLAVATA3/ESR (CLE)-related protein [Parasponia andersonii]|uniref:CLAVATA3/ESR (CLE)-related protein n=1 Tax=Parasponia andersonii TaxID=3476 RepID=A0A2P5AZH1_PARAD|nr:CLAVATA3/ESR (CLE)-related protein [Parasponia andersonii]